VKPPPRWLQVWDSAVRFGSEKTGIFEKKARPAKP